MNAPLHLLSLVGQLIDSLVRFLPVLEQAEILLYNIALRVDSHANQVVRMQCRRSFSKFGKRCGGKFYPGRLVAYRPLTTLAGLAATLPTRPFKH